MGAFTLANAVGEIGGLFYFADGALERTCQSICSSLWRSLAFCEFVLFHRHVRDIQVLAAAAERMAVRKHEAYGLTLHRVAGLQRQARRVARRIFLGYVCWFLYSSMAVVSQPLVEWAMTGRRPQPLLSSSFWLVVPPDTPAREMAMYISQSGAQFACTVIAIGYLTFFSSLTFFLSYQARIVGVLLEDIPYSVSRLSPAGEREVRMRVVHCIAFHQDVLYLAAELNRVLRLMLMILFMIVLGFIANMIYQMAVVPPDDAVFMATLMVLICSNSQVAVFCFASDSLRQTTEDVVHRVMASDWTDASAPTQALLKLLVFRATKPVSLWAWRVFTVSLPTWLQVLNKSYSVFAVMRS
nr:odorant receptor [Odontothrips loti]